MKFKVIIVLVALLVIGGVIFAVKISNNDDSSIISHYLKLDESKLNQAQKTLFETTKSKLESDPKNTEAMTDLGVLYYTLENYDAAEKILDYANELKPNDTMILQNLASVYHNQARYQEAEALYYKILDNNILWMQAFESLSQLYRFKQVAANTKFPELLAKARTLDYGDQYEQPLLKMLAFYYDYQGDTAKALEYFKEYVKKYPDDKAIIDVYHDLGGK